MTKRTFEDRQAVREQVPLLIGLGAPSSGGKTFSALRLAAGIKKVTGGETFMIDTEARRSLHYADNFDFRFVQFDAPFDPGAYKEAIAYCIDKGAKQIIVDSMSHEHEGQGGVLEWHDRETGGQEKNNFRAWAKPKAARRDMINYMLQQPANFILCFRCKDKIKPPKGGGQPQEMGWSLIGAEELAFEMTVRFLLYPQSDGIPTLKSSQMGEKAAIKVPEQFKGLVTGYDKRSVSCRRRRTLRAVVSTAMSSKQRRFKCCWMDIQPSR